MKKPLVIVLLFFCSSLLSLCKAQDEPYIQPGTAIIFKHDTTKTKRASYKPTGYLSFTVGAGIPLGKYRDSGFATVGLNLSLSGASLLKNKNYGDAFRIDYGFNPMNDYEFQNALQSSLNSALHTSGITCTANSVGNLTYKTLFVGFYGTYPHEKYSFDFKAFFGVMYSTLPKINVNVSDSGRLLLTASEAEAVASSFAFSAEGGVRYQIMPGFNLMGCINILYSKPQFSVTLFGQSINGALQPEAGWVSQPFELANVSVGLTWTPPKPASRHSATQYNEPVQANQPDKSANMVKPASPDTSLSKTGGIPPAPGKADEYKPKGYLSIGGGRAWPFKNYRDSGFALPGINVEVSGAYPFKKSGFGGAFRIDYLNNPVDHTAFINALQNTLAYTTHQYYLKYNINSLGNYSFETLLAGLNVTLPDVQFCLDFRALVGFIFEQTPSANVSVYNNGSLYETVSGTKQSSTLFGYNFGGGIRYHITPKISAIASFDYLISSLSFLISPLKAGASSGGLVQTIVNTGGGNGTQPIASANVTLGIAWTLQGR